MKSAVKIFAIASAFACLLAGTAWAQSSSLFKLNNGVILPVTSTWQFEIPQLGGSGVRCVQVDNNGLFSVASGACGSGGGGGSGGTWSTTTSSVSGRLINYTNNNTDIVCIGGQATTTCPMFFDPNTLVSYIKGNLGISTTSPYAPLSVVGAGGVVADNYTATSTLATSTFRGGLFVSSTTAVLSVTSPPNSTFLGTIRQGQGSGQTFIGGAQGRVSEMNDINGDGGGKLGAWTYTNTGTINAVNVNASNDMIATDNVRAGNFFLYGSGNVLADNLSNLYIGDQMGGGQLFDVNGSTGGNGQVLTNVSGAPLWQTPSGGTVTEVDTTDGSLTGGPCTTTCNLALNTGHVNSFSALQKFNANASTTILSVSLDGLATTTILSQATSTFAKGVSATIFNATSATASSTFVNGINLNNGCFAISNVCVTGGGGGSGTVLTGTAGQTPFYSSGGTVLTATSTIFILARSGTTGFVGVGTTSPGQLLDVWGNISVSNGSSITTDGNNATGNSSNLTITTGSPPGVAGQGSSGSITISPASPVGSMNSGSVTISTPFSSVTGQPITLSTASGANLGGNIVLSAGTGVTTNGAVLITGNVGIASSTPWAKLGIGIPVYNAAQPMFAIGSSTASGTSTPLIVDGNGSTGVGTSTPSGPVCLAMFCVTNPNTDANIVYFQRSTKTLGLNLADSGSLTIGASFFPGNQSTANFQAGSLTLNSSAATISNSSNAGASNIKITGGAAGDSRIDFRTTSSASQTADAFRFLIGAAGANQFVTIQDTNGTGAMGIGTTSPWGILSVASTTSATAQLTPYFVVASSTQAGSMSPIFIVAANTFVGVATTSPWRTLSVGGSLAVSNLTAFALNDSAVCQRAGGEITVDSGVSSCIVSSKYTKDYLGKEDYAEAKRKIDELNIITFKYKGTEGKQDIGAYAEDVAKIDPRYAQYALKEESMDGHLFHVGDPKAINWSAIQADMIVVMQHQSDSSSGESAWPLWIVIGALIAFNIRLIIKKK